MAMPKVAHFPYMSLEPVGG